VKGDDEEAAGVERQQPIKPLGHHLARNVHIILLFFGARERELERFKQVRELPAGCSDATFAAFQRGTADGVAR